MTEEASTDRLRERVVSSRVLHKGHYLTFRIDTIERADGTVRERDVCGPPGAVEEPTFAAPRELEEETGYRAERWQLLGSFWTAPGFATELMHLYLASDLRPAAADRRGPDEDERLELERLPWREAVAAAESGAIVDAKSIVGLFWLARLMEVDRA